MTAGGNNNKGLVAYVEGYCNNIPLTESSISAGGSGAVGGGGGEPKPQWWAEALTLGHLETRMYTAKMLDSPAEYKQALLAYARRLADEGFRWKADELIRELFGPVYWCVYTSVFLLKKSDG